MATSKQVSMLAITASVFFCLLHVNAKVPAPIVDPAFVHAGNQSGTEIWRMEKFKPVPVPLENYGKFHTGDSYLLLRTVSGAGSKSFSRNAHTWRGNDSTIDEYTTAAFKMTELGNLVGARHHTELQSQESSLFLSYFPSGIKYLPGGVAGGLRATNRSLTN